MGWYKIYKKRLDINFDDIQKAMEDVSRDAFEYFLDIETGDVIILSVDILNRAQEILEDIYDEDMAEYDEVELYEEKTIPEWIEDEIELSLNILLYESERFVKIPERSPKHGYTAMKEFIETLTDPQLKVKLSRILDGKGAFRRFKDALEQYPKERKLWYGFNAKANRQVIEKWLKTLGVEPSVDI